MTITEAAARIGKHNDTIRRAIQAGKLESIKVNGTWDISEEALAAYANTQGVAYADLGTEPGYAAAYDETMQLRMQNEDLKQQVEYLKGQIQEKDQQVENLQIQLSDASQRHDIVVMQMSKMLEYERQPFWRRWFKHKALPAPGDVMDMEPGTEEEPTPEEN
ncbi:excisionase family DNA-binding protein [Candidatus Poribacteria bacterium]